MSERSAAIGCDGGAWARVLTAMAPFSMPVVRSSGAFALQNGHRRGADGALLSREGMRSAGAASLRPSVTPIASLRVRSWLPAHTDRGGAIVPHRYGTSTPQLEPI